MKIRLRDLRRMIREIMIMKAMDLADVEPNSYERSLGPDAEHDFSDDEQPDTQPVRAANRSR